MKLTILTFLIATLLPWVSHADPGLMASPGRVSLTKALTESQRDQRLGEQQLCNTLGCKKALSKRFLTDVQQKLLKPKEVWIVADKTNEIQEVSHENN